MEPTKRIVGSKKEFYDFRNDFLKKIQKNEINLPYAAKMVSTENVEIIWSDNAQSFFKDFIYVISDFCEHFSCGKDMIVVLPLTTGRILKIFDVYLEPFDSDQDENVIFNFLKQASIGEKENKQVVICSFYGSRKIFDSYKNK